MEEKCKICNTILEFDFGAGLYYCNKCCNFYSVSEFQSDVATVQYERDVAYADDSRIIYECDEVYEYTNQPVYSCSSCKSSFMYTEVLEDNRCPYCGEESLTSQGVKSVIKPSFYVPFKIDKKVAIEHAKKKMSSNIFTPLKFRKIRENEIKSVYVPYYYFDMAYRAKGKYNSEELTVEKTGLNFYDADIKLNVKVPGNLSNNNIDKSHGEYFSNELGFSDVKGKMPFSDEDMKGHFVQCNFNENDKVPARNIAIEKAKKCFARLSKGAFSNIHNRRMYTFENHKLNDMEILSDIVDFSEASHVAIPAWVITKKYRNRKYKIIVNGIDGEVIGILPGSRLKPVLLLSAILTMLHYVFLRGTYCPPELNLYTMQRLNVLMVLEGIVLLGTFLGLFWDSFGFDIN